MFDVSWGELLVLAGVGAALAGRKDLPVISRFAGQQLGRIVGLLQGARARADQFTAQHELRQLQNELRSGLRELDQVKTELALAASSRGVIGRTLGTTVLSANRLNAATTISPKIQRDTTHLLTSTLPARDLEVKIPLDQIPYTPSANLAPVSQSERAVLDEEWEKQGIGFRSRAEAGEWIGDRKSMEGTGGKTGSELLENLIKQSLIFDQYDRVVGEQERAMQDRIQSIKDQRNAGLVQDSIEQNRKD